MFESNKRCETCANRFRQDNEGCSSCVDGNNHTLKGLCYSDNVFGSRLTDVFTPLPSFSLTGTIVIDNYKSLFRFSEHASCAVRFFARCSQNRRQYFVY